MQNSSLLHKSLFVIHSILANHLKPMLSTHPKIEKLPDISDTGIIIALMLKQHCIASELIMSLKAYGFLSKAPPSISSKAIKN